MGLLEFLLVQSVAKGIKSSSDEAARRKLEEKTEAAAEAAGLTVYAYVLTQVRESIRNSVMEKQNDLGKLETYLNICMDQRILSEYHRDADRLSGPAGVPGECDQGNCGSDPEYL